MASIKLKFPPHIFLAPNHKLKIASTRLLHRPGRFGGIYSQEVWVTPVDGQDPDYQHFDMSQDVLAKFTAQNGKARLRCFRAFSIQHLTPEYCESMRGYFLHYNCVLADNQKLVQKVPYAHRRYATEIF